MNGNQAYTRGWQMGMQMIQAGAQKRRAETQKRQFKKELDLSERRVDLLEEAEKTRKKAESQRRELVGLQIEEAQNKQKGREILRRFSPGYGGPGMSEAGKRNIYEQMFPEMAAKLMFQKPTVPTTKRVWDKQTKQYVQRSQVEINKDPDRYGMTEKTFLKGKTAGAPKISIGEQITARKTAETQYAVEKDPSFIPKVIQEFKTRYEDWDLMDSEARENLLMVHVKDTLSALYKDVHFERNKKTGEVELWGSGKKIRSWPKKNF